MANTILDPADDAPEITEEWLEGATLCKNGVPIEKPPQRTYGPRADDMWLFSARECFQDYYGLDYARATFASNALLARGDKEKYQFGYLAAMAHMDSGEPPFEDVHVH